MNGNTLELSSIEVEGDYTFFSLNHEKLDHHSSKTEKAWKFWERAQSESVLSKNPYQSHPKPIVQRN
jgi:hypothetical protein